MARPRMLASALLGALLLCASTVVAQESKPGGRNEVSVQGMGFFTKDSRGNGLTQHSTDTGGFLLSYRYHFNRWLAADASYGYARNTQQNGTLDVQANVHQATGTVVVTIPRRVSRFNSYLLAGAGALVFDPTGNFGGFVVGASRQAKAAFVYGGGVDYDLTRHFALRVEYRGFVYGRPDFGLAALHSSSTTHTAQPSAGIVFHF
jgi:opacity protein-like surface antigen